MRWLSWFRSQPQASLSEIRRSFEEAAGDDERFPATIDPRIFHVQLIARYFGDLAGKTVLDVGCGKGRFARVLKDENPGVNIVALDLAEAMLRHVGQALSPCSGSMTALPFRSGAFDAAYATESLEHAVDIETAIAEICRVVKSGGRIVIIDKNAEHWGALKTPRWERWFHRKELERLLGRYCNETSSQLISYWEDVPADGLFVAWLAVK